MAKRKLIRIYDVIGFGKASVGVFTEYLSDLSSGDTLTMLIYSPGGVLTEGLVIYNELKILSSKGVLIESIAVGDASSAATLLFLAADKDKRYVTKGSSFLVHRPSSFVSGFSDDIENEADFLKRLSDDIVDIYSNETGIDRDVIIDTMSGDGTLFTSKDFIETGWASGFADFNKLKIDKEEKRIQEISAYYNDLFMSRKQAVVMSGNVDKKEKQQNGKVKMDKLFTQADIDKARLDGAVGEIKRRGDFADICPIGYEGDMVEMLKDPSKTASDFAVHIAKMEKQAKQKAAVSMQTETSPPIPPVRSNGGDDGDEPVMDEKYFSKQWESGKVNKAAFWNKKENYIAIMKRKVKNNG